MTHTELIAHLESLGWVDARPRLPTYLQRQWFCRDPRDINTLCVALPTAATNLERTKILVLRWDSPIDRATHYYVDTPEEALVVLATLVLTNDNKM